MFVHASLDDSGERGMLQRKGLDWDLALSNRKKMLEVCPNVDFIITTTISVFNLFHIPIFHKELVLNKYIKIDEFIPHVLKSPAYYNIRILPIELKVKAKQIIEEHILWIIEYAKQNPPDEPKPEQVKKYGGNFDLMDIPKVTGHGKLDIQINELKQCIVFMNSADETHLISEFIRVTEQLDKLRNESTRIIIPELKSFWTYSNKVKN